MLALYIDSHPKLYAELIWLIWHILNKLMPGPVRKQWIIDGYTFTSGLQAFWQFSINKFHSKDAKQNLFSSKFFLLVFKSNLRYFMISKNLLRGIVALNKGHSQDLCHILFYKQSTYINYAT